MRDKALTLFRIVIVGGGIAGLSTAIGLRKKRFAVTVIERHPSCQTLGAPLRLGPNATRVLISYGMEDELVPLNAEGEVSVIKRYDGQLLLETSVKDMRQSFGAP
jgi:salicylate hydroxylase